MLIDLHAHTAEISWCCCADHRTILQTARDSGFDGVAITNHYCRSYFEKTEYLDWIEAYIAEWHACRTIGEELGMHVFCGIEVTMEFDPRIHLLIYGADEAFLRENPHLCNMSHEALYRLCKENSCALVQAHPYRNGTTMLDTNLLNGVEVNCHPIYGNSFAEDVLWEAKKASLAVTVGCDYHADTYRPKGGMMLPETVQSDRELATYILHSNRFLLQIHEPANGSMVQQVYERICD